jgi:hypothetical protein
VGGSFFFSNFFSDDDEAWGMIDIEGLHLVAAEDVADSQAAAGQHVIEIVKGEPGYSFGKFMGKTLSENLIFVAHTKTSLLWH